MPVSNALSGSTRLARVALGLFLLVPCPVLASDTRGPFGPEFPVSAEIPGGSDHCAPDSRGVTVRLMEIYDNDETPENEYRALISRVDSAGIQLEPPFGFSTNPSMSYPGLLACDGKGGFLVTWENVGDECLRVRAFDRFGAPLADERLLTPGCAARAQALMQLEYGSGGHYRLLWGDPGVKREKVYFQSLDSRAESSTPPVLLKRRRITTRFVWQSIKARADDEAALVVWIRNQSLRGQVIGVDGVAVTEVFDVNLAPDGAAFPRGIDDLGSGVMVPRWSSYWQAGLIAREVAVSTDIPVPQTTTTTTLPDDSGIPWFEPGEPLQRLHTKEGRQWAGSPELAASSEGTAVAVWIQTHFVDEYRTASQVSYSRRDPQTGEWTARREFPQHSSAQFGRPRIVHDGDGKWTAMWAQASGHNCHLVTSRSEDDARTWSPWSVAVANFYLGIDEGRCNLEFNVAADPHGAWIIVWGDNFVSGSEPTFLLRTSRSVDHGATWSEPSAALVLDTGAWGDYALAPDGHGNWGIAWSNNFYTVYSDHTVTGGEVLFSRSEDNGVTWNNPVTIAGAPSPNTGMPIHTAPDLATDGSGNWLVAWASDDTLAGATADWDLLLSRSADGGATWSAPRHVAPYSDEDDNQDAFPSLATDRAGRWLLAWTTTFSVPGAAGLDYDIAVAASDDVGGTWTTPVALDRRADTDKRADYFGDVASAGAGTWLAVWLSQSEIPEKRGTAVIGAELDE